MAHDGCVDLLVDWTWLFDADRINNAFSSPQMKKLVVNNNKKKPIKKSTTIQDTYSFLQ